MATRPSEWYAGGLRFTCTQCGNCCTGPPGAVWFVEREGIEMARALGLEKDAFYAQYARKLEGGWSLVERQTEHGYDCVFLDRKTIPGKAICSVYETRPSQCRTWPFWPENLSSKRVWTSTKRTTPCPGMDEGALVKLTQIRVLRDARPADWVDGG